MMRNRSFRKLCGFVAAFLVLFMVTALYSGVVFAEEKEEAKTEITVWTGLEQKELETLKAVTHQFSVKEGVKVWVIQKPLFEMKGMLLKNVNGKNRPDLILAPNDWIGELASAGVISPLSNGDFNRRKKFRYVKVSLKAVSWDGKTWGVPYFMETLAVVYNKALVKEEPKTFEDLLKNAQEIQENKKGVYGLLWENDNFYTAWPFFAGFGAEIFKDGKLVLDSEKSVKALEYLKDFKNKYGLSNKTMKPAEIQELFIQGKAAYVIEGPWAVKSFRQSFVNYGVMDFPGMANGRRPEPFVSVNALMIHSKTSERKKVIDLVRFVSSRKNQQIFCSVDNRIPTRKDVKLSTKEFVEISTYWGVAKRSIPVPVAREMAFIWEPMKGCLKQVLVTGTDPAKSLKNHVELIRKAISKAK